MTHVNNLYIYICFRFTSALRGYHFHELLNDNALVKYSLWGKIKTVF